MASLNSAFSSPTVDAIYAYWAAQPSRNSRRLGASQIGEDCERRLWYAFRWTITSGGQFDGRMRRLFDRGHREEAVFIKELQAIGVQVHSHDPRTGEQFEFSACGGHFVAKIDGAGLGIVEAPKAWHVLTFKTSNAKGWTLLHKNGVEKEQPKNWAQAQVEMHLTGMDRALLLSVNKDTDELHGERIRADAKAGERLEAKADRIIFAVEPLERLSADPAFFKCKFCPFTGHCHSDSLADVSCRTCVHATPERDGDGRWSCARLCKDLAMADQEKACPDHLYIPALVRWGAAVDANQDENWIEYETPDGFRFRNAGQAARAADAFGSRELRALSLTALRDPQLRAIRAGYLPDAQFVAEDAA